MKSGIAICCGLSAMFVAVGCAKSEAQTGPLQGSWELVKTTMPNGEVVQGIKLKGRDGVEALWGRYVISFEEPNSMNSVVQFLMKSNTEDSYLGCDQRLKVPILQKEREFSVSDAGDIESNVWTYTYNKEPKSQLKINSSCDNALSMKSTFKILERSASRLVLEFKDERGLVNTGEFTLTDLAPKFEEHHPK